MHYHGGEHGVATAGEQAWEEATEGGSQRLGCSCVVPKVRATLEDRLIEIKRGGGVR